MKTMFKRLQRGQGLVEYALMIAAVAIVALAVITVFADPNDWRNGLIYQGIYRPVQCVIQGISRDDCANAGEFNVVGFPSITNGNSRKQCNSWASDEDLLDGDDYTAPVVPDDGSGDVFVACQNGSGGAGGGDNSIWTAVEFIQYKEQGADTWITLDGSNQIVQGQYDFRAVWKRYVPDDPATDGVDEEQPYVEPEVVEFTLRGTDGTATSFTTLNQTRDMQSGTANEVDPFNSREDQFRLMTDLEETPEQFLDITLTGEYEIRAEAFHLDGQSQTELNSADSVPIVRFEVTEPPAPIITNVVMRDVANPDPPLTFTRTSNDFTMAKALYTIQVNTNQNQPNDELSYTVTYLDNPATLTDEVDTVEDSGTLIYDPNTPYLLYAPAGSDFVAGDYEVAFTLSNAAGDIDNNADTGVIDGTMTINFTIDAPPLELVVNGFTLIDANTDTEIEAVTDNPTFDTANAIVLDGTPGSGDLVSFVANVADEEGVVQSVILELTDENGNEIHQSSPESTPPYALYANNGGDYDGDYLSPGNYILTATPYSEDNAGGIAGDPVSVNFVVVAPIIEEGPLARFYVQNTSKGGNYDHEFELSALNTKSGLMTGGTTEINLDDVNYNWNIAVVADPKFITRVQFTLQATGGGGVVPSGKQDFRENIEPYHAKGDNKSLNLPLGDYRMTARVINGSDETTYELNFTVITNDVCQLEVEDRPQCSSEQIRLFLETGPNCIGVAQDLTTIGAGMEDTLNIGSSSKSIWTYWSGGSKQGDKVRFYLNRQWPDTFDDVCDGDFDPIPIVLTMDDGTVYNYEYEFGPGSDGRISLP